MKITEAVNKSLFFTGAGASRDAGCKISGDMLTSLKELICKKSNDYFSEIECETIKFLLSCLYYHAEWRTLELNNQYPITPNIEELALLIRRIRNRENFLPYPVTGNWADKLISLEAKFKEEEGLKNGYSLFEKIEDTLKNRMLPHWLKVGNTDFLNPLDDFFEKNSSNDFSLEIFTLNNDTAVEEHYSEKKAKPYRGFYSGEWRGFDGKTNEEEFNRINLYKLHGSLDWIRLNDGNVVESGRTDDFLQDDEGGIRVEHNPFIIFGHGIKFFSVEPFFSLIQQFSEKLRERSYYFVIGYSFFDPYINNLLLQAIKDAREENKKIIIVNPFFAQPPLIKDYFEEDEEFGSLLNENNPEAKRLLTSYLEEIQRNAFYSELPEFNIKQIPTESIFLIKMDTSNFLEKYLKNSGELLVKLIDKFEQERKKGLPF